MGPVEKKNFDDLAAKLATIFASYDGLTDDKDLAVIRQNMGTSCLSKQASTVR